MSTRQSAPPLVAPRRRAPLSSPFALLRKLGGRFADPDRFGAVAAGACAVHCAATPLILVFLPAIGGAWASPEVHWITAAISLPLAGWVLFRGLRRHPSRGIATCAVLGMVGIVVGLILPELDPNLLAFVHGHEPAAPGAPASACDTCTSCCPTVEVTEDGKITAHVPPASVTTFAGGLLLCTAHVGNLARRKRSCPDGCCDTSE